MSDIASILTDDELATVRAGYDRAGLLGAAAAATSGLFPDAAPFLDFVGSHFYQRWPPVERERVLIALLAVSERAEGMLFTVHLYWGLMEGLSPAEIGDLLLLVGVYHGLPRFTAGVAKLRALLLLLKSLAGSGATTAAVMPALRTL